MSGLKAFTCYVNDILVYIRDLKHASCRPCAALKLGRDYLWPLSDSPSKYLPINDGVSQK